eukprot:GHVS01023961.1.p1 GENE.GHVS01023961.1~~GHVS01023961.1.p1  ORF type:complete len:192 (+),score=18.13 GHVS01023961.1:351-926(+)
MATSKSLVYMVCSDGTPCCLHFMCIAHVWSPDDTSDCRLQSTYSADRQLRCCLSRLLISHSSSSQQKQLASHMRYYVAVVQGAVLQHHEQEHDMWHFVVDVPQARINHFASWSPLLTTDLHFLLHLLHHDATKRPLVSLPRRLAQLAHQYQPIFAEILHSACQSVQLLTHAVSKVTSYAKTASTLHQCSQC